MTRHLVGSTFGQLRVVALVEGRTKQGRLRWVCRCECGAETIVDTTALVSGNTKSCGHSHGMAGHPIYRAYINAQSRCTKPYDKEYARYGGRGIEFRLAPVERFIALMQPSWFEGATLGRIDNDKHYEYGNIRWETRKEQAQNRRSTVLLTYNGLSMTQSDWAKHFGVRDCAIAWRVKHWGVERALSTPFKRNK